MTIVAVMKRFPRLKYCGITRDVDVEGAISSGATALGLNFYPRSKRYVEPQHGARLSTLASGRILRVGVFVNASPSEVLSLIERCPLDAIQLHGDETLDWVASAQRLEGLRGLPILRALAYRGNVDDAVISAWSRASLDPASAVAGLLIDAHDPNERGGTGKTAAWELLCPRPASFSVECDEDATRGSPPARVTAPLVLAGGIHPGNVEEAMRRVRPEGIDVASGIESSPGIKDLKAMKEVAEVVARYLDLSDR